MGAGVAGGAAGVYTGDLVRLAQLGTILSLLQYNRTMEAEADAMGLKLIAEAGLRPMAMSETWDQLIGELDASARYRRKKRERRINLFETHPSPDSRRTELRISAAEVTVPGKLYDDGRARYLEAIGRIRPTLLDDQVKLNDPGASQYIVEKLAIDGWNGLLRFNEAEIWRLRNRAGDDARAALGYAAAVGYPDAPPDAWRWHGVMLQKAGRDGRSAGGLHALFADGAQRPRRPVHSPVASLSERSRDMKRTIVALAAASVALGGCSNSARRRGVRLRRLFADPPAQRRGRRRVDGGHPAARVEPGQHAPGRSTTSARSRTGRRTARRSIR